MTFLVILLAVLALIVLISGGKTNAFLAFLLVTVPAGLALGKWKPSCRKGWVIR